MAVAEISSAISRKAWFLPFNTKTFVTRPNCWPKFITSGSLASFGMFLMWITRDGFPGVEEKISWNLGELHSKRKNSGQKSSHKTVCYFKEAQGFFLFRLTFFFFHDRIVKSRGKAEKSWADVADVLKALSAKLHERKAKVYVECLAVNSTERFKSVFN